LDHPDIEDAIAGKPINRLIDKLKRRHTEQNSLALRPSHLDDGRSNDGFSCPGRGLDDWASFARSEGFAELVYGVVLVITQEHRFSPFL
jgi:hypothetical protein